MQKFILTGFISLLLFSCTQKQVVSENEISTYLISTPNKPLKSIETEITFWSNRFKIVKDDLSAQLKLGSLYNQKFQYSGNINDILISDSFYLQAHQLQKYFSSGTYRSLAANSITHHKFKEAKAFLDTAYSLGDDKYFTLLQQFDVAVELGNYSHATSILKEFRYKNTFEYYIRNAKLQDHLGNAEASIEEMEKGVTEAAKLKNEQLLRWAKSNMADMYGHQNNIEKSYQLYKEVLESDPHYYHALKGIAWIAFSHDKNTSLAKTILAYLKRVHTVPDYDYLLAEIAAYENNPVQQKIYTNQFLEEVKKPAYGDMYNKYVFSLLSDEPGNYYPALLIAEKEVYNRPTPQSYDLLAWAYYKNNQKTAALQIAESKLVKINFEPDALYHLGLVYKQNGNDKLAKYYLKEALESSFELGPVVTKEIEQQLLNL